MQLKTFEERLQYLRLKSVIGEVTFGGHRFINQEFYKSSEWKNLRHKVILRDNACDLAIEDNPISDNILVHHIVPISLEDFEHPEDLLMNPDNLITTTHATHNLIHYGNDTSCRPKFVERRPNDTIPWR